MSESIKIQDNTTFEPHMTVAEAAAIVRVSPTKVMEWIAKGDLRALVPPGVKLGDRKRGPKSIRIPVAEWRAFNERQLIAGITKQPEVQRQDRAKVRTGGTAGTDGIDRRRRRTVR